MHRVTGNLELAALNSDLAAAYLDDAVAECSAIVDRLDDCLASVRELKRSIMPAECGAEDIP